jgi:hypothetical protein
MMDDILTNLDNEFNDFSIQKSLALQESQRPVPKRRFSAGYDVRKQQQNIIENRQRAGTFLKDSKSYEDQLITAREQINASNIEIDEWKQAEYWAFYHPEQVPNLPAGIRNKARQIQESGNANIYTQENIQKEQARIQEITQRNNKEAENYMTTKEGVVRVDRTKPNNFVMPIQQNYFKDIGELKNKFSNLPRPDPLLDIYTKVNTSQRKYFTEPIIFKPLQSIGINETSFAGAVGILTSRTPYVKYSKGYKENFIESASKSIYKDIREEPFKQELLYGAGYTTGALFNVGRAGSYFVFGKYGEKGFKAGALTLGLIGSATFTNKKVNEILADPSKSNAGKIVGLGIKDISLIGLGAKQGGKAFKDMTEKIRLERFMDSKKNPIVFKTERTYFNKKMTKGVDVTKAYKIFEGDTYRIDTTVKFNLMNNKKFYSLKGSGGITRLTSESSGEGVFFESKGLSVSPKAKPSYITKNKDFFLRETKNLKSGVGISKVTSRYQYDVKISKNLDKTNVNINYEPIEPKTLKFEGVTQLKKIDKNTFTVLGYKVKGSRINPYEFKIFAEPKPIVKGILKINKGETTIVNIPELQEPRLNALKLFKSKKAQATLPSFYTETSPKFNFDSKGTSYLPGLLSGASKLIKPYPLEKPFIMPIVFSEIKQEQRPKIKQENLLKLAQEKKTANITTLKFIDLNLTPTKERTGQLPRLALRQRFKDVPLTPPKQRYKEISFIPINIPSVPKTQRIILFPGSLRPLRNKSLMPRFPKPSKNRLLYSPDLTSVILGKKTKTSYKELSKNKLYNTLGIRRIPV